MLMHCLGPSVKSVADLKLHLAAVLDDAAFCQHFAQAGQAAYNGKRYTPPSYKLDDEVFLSKRLFKTAVYASQRSQKLGFQRHGPFRVVELIGENAVRLELPGTMHIHPVLHVKHTSKVRRYPQDIANDESSPSLPLVDDQGELVIEVSEILGHEKRGRSFQFLTLFKSATDHKTE